MEILNLILRTVANVLFATWLIEQFFYIKSFIKYNRDLIEIKKDLYELEKKINIKLKEMQNEG